MITDEELLNKIDQVSGDFHGQLDDLYKVVGMIVMGRYYGWRVVRLVSTRPLWTQATKLFGDPKLLMPERGRYAHKSVGLKLVDDVGRFRDAVNGVFQLPTDEKKRIV